jgi:hypothetical protein
MLCVWSGAQCIPDRVERKIIISLYKSSQELLPFEQMWSQPC